MSSNVRRGRLRRGRSKNVFDKAGSRSLFAGVKAWFSSSVDHSRRVAWINHGGTCCHWKEAQLLFSDDQDATDTTERAATAQLHALILSCGQSKLSTPGQPTTLVESCSEPYDWTDCFDIRELQFVVQKQLSVAPCCIAGLFEQMEFLWGYVTVFHSSFISACIKERNMENVVIAPFLMLPPEFPLVNIKDIPSGVSQITCSSNESDKVEDQQVFKRPPKRHKRRLEFSQQKSAQSVLCNTKKHHSTTFPMNCIKDPCTSCEKSFRFCNGVEEDRSDNDVPLSDLESIPHASSLKRTSLRLSDFVPYQNGCAVSRKV